MPNLTLPHWQLTSFSTASVSGVPNFTAFHAPRHNPISPYRHSTGGALGILSPWRHAAHLLTYPDHLALLHFEVAIEADPVHSNLTPYEGGKLTQLLTSTYHLFYLLYFNLGDLGERKKICNTQTMTISISDGSKESEMTFKVRRDEKIQKSVEAYLDKWSRGA